MKTIDVAEQYADGMVTWDRFDEVATEAHYVQPTLAYTRNPVVGETVVSMMSQLVGDRDDVWDSVFGIADYACEAVGGDPTRPSKEEGEAQCNLARDIFGNPFRPVTFDPTWRTSTALALACGIYDDRAFERLPILADALQDAGCENDDILNHLRDPNATHVRGCWALDLVLGKE